MKKVQIKSSFKMQSATLFLVVCLAIFSYSKVSADNKPKNPQALVRRACGFFIYSIRNVDWLGIIRALWKKSITFGPKAVR